MRMTRDLLGHAWPLMLGSGSAGLVAGFSSAGLLALINEALAQNGQVSSSGGYSLAAYFVGLCVLVFASGVLSEILLVRLGQSGVLNLRMTLSQRLLATPWSQVQALGPPRLQAALTEDIATIAAGYEILPILFINGAIVLGCLLYLGYLSLPLLALVLVFIAVGVVLFQLLQHRALNQLEAARTEGDRLYGHFRALVEGGKELRMHQHRRQAFLDGELGQTAQVIRTHFTAGMTNYIMATHWGNLLFYVVIGAVLFLLPILYSVTSATMVAYVMTILYLMTPLATLMHALPDLGRAVVALKKLDALNLTLGETTQSISSQDLGGPQPGVLQIKGLTHTYRTDSDESGFPLGPIDLTLQPGELVFLTGGNGSGKTTFAMLLLGLYSPEHGGIYLNGELVTDANREAYRQLFGAVFADAYLFERLLGIDNTVVDDKAHAWLLKLHLHSKVKIEQGKFSTLALSQGQRKRLALLAAILDDRPFYLFDEWAADQDPEFKKIFYEELLPELRTLGKTLIVISHDDHYYHLADRCLKFESGLLKEQPVQQSMLTKEKSPIKVHEIVNLRH